MHRGKGIAAAVVAAVVLMLLLWGSGSGSQVLSSPSGEAGPLPPPTAPQDPASQDVAATTSGANVLEPAAPALDWLMVFFALLGLAIAVTVIRWLLHREWEESQAPEEDVVPDDLDLLMEATSETARTSAVAEGEPRNVVVRCWVALEDAADASGLPRDAAETAAEFTRRFLGVWEVDRGLTQELADLYREARFSRHPVAASEGARAVEIVSAIHEQLRASHTRRTEAETEAAQAEAALTTPAGASSSTTGGNASATGTPSSGDRDGGSR